MAGPGFAPHACVALPTAAIAVMGPEAAVNAVYANRIAAIEDPAEREAFVAARRAEYLRGRRPAPARVGPGVDAVVEPEDLREDLVRRLAYASRTRREFSDRRHGVWPV